MNTGAGTISKVTAPAANAALASITGLTPSTQYNITVLVAIIAGTPAAVDAGNIKLLVGSTVLFNIANGIQVGQQQRFNYTITTDSAGTISLQAIASATAGVTYMTQITADSGSI